MADQDKQISDLKEETALLEKLDKFFRSALDHPSWIEGRDKMLQCFQYREGEQWTTSEKAELAKRNQPDTVNNQVAITVNKFIGDLVDQKFRVGYRGRNSPMDDGVAKAMSDIFLYIKQTNDLEFEERDMADDGFTGGMGVMDVHVTFDDMFQPQINIEHEDPLVVFPDPWSRRYDWNKDASFIARAKWFDLEEVIARYPEKKAALQSIVNSGPMNSGGDASSLSAIDKFRNDNYIDFKRKRVRLIEVQYKKVKREELLIFEDGTTELKENLTTEQLKPLEGKFKTLERIKPVINVGMIGPAVLLDHKETDWKYYSLVPYFAYRKKNGAPYSLISLVLSMQDAINKRESKALHLLNTNQTLFETGSIADKEKFAEELAKPDGQLEVQQGSLTQQRVQIQKNIELALSQFQMHGQAKEAFFQITGVDPRVATQTGELRSARALNQKIVTANKPIAPLFENLRRTRKILGRVVMDRVQKNYTPNKVLLITDELEQTTPLTLDKPLLEKIKSAQYDVVIDDFIDAPTARAAEFDMITQTLPQILPFGGFWVKKLIELSELPNKAKVIEELKGQEGPPPVDPRVNVQAQLDKLDSKERAEMWKRMGSPELAAQILQDDPMSTDELEASTALAKETIKANAKREGDLEKTVIQAATKTHSEQTKKDTA